MRPGHCLPALCVFLLCMGMGIAAGESLIPSKVKRLKGEEINDSVLGSLNASDRILVTDFMGDINNNFTPEETKRGLRGPYYTKFNLRDSKLRCIISKYDAKNFKRLGAIKKNDRVTVVGRVDQLAMGLKRFSKPYYILRLSHMEPGWLLHKDQDVLSGVEPNTEYEDVAPHALSAKADDYAGEYVRLKDRFSITSTMFTTFEKDLNLSNNNTLKFYLENCTIPCYMPSNDKNKEFLATLKSGDQVTVSARLNLSTVGDEALLLLTITRIKQGW